MPTWKNQKWRNHQVHTSKTTRASRASRHLYSPPTDRGLPDTQTSQSQMKNETTSRRFSSPTLTNNIWTFSTSKTSSRNSKSSRGSTWRKARTATCRRFTKCRSNHFWKLSSKKTRKLRVCRIRWQSIKRMSPRGCSRRSTTSKNMRCMTRTSPIRLTG